MAILVVVVVVMMDDGECIYCNSSCNLGLILNTYYEVMDIKLILQCLMPNAQRYIRVHLCRLAGRRGRQDASPSISTQTISYSDSPALPKAAPMLYLL